MLGATLVYGSLQVMLFAMYAVAYPTAAQVSKDLPGTCLPVPPMRPH